MRFVNRAWTNSLSFKVILAYVAGVGLSVLIIGGGVKGLLVFRSPILLEEDVNENAEGLAKHLRFDASGAPVGVALMSPSSSSTVTFTWAGS